MSQTFFLQETLARIKEQGLLRILQPVAHLPRGRILVSGRPFLNLSSNDYLGLSQHPALKEAALEATGRFGVGAGASRLITGNHELYEKLEDRIARFKGTQAALVFSSGYTANIGVLSALVDRDDRVFSDELNHASIIDGLRMSRGQVFVYRHNDAAHLEELLNHTPKRGKTIIVTDSVFSMDGDLAPLPRLTEIKNKYGAILILDEAHATGVIGERGGGLAQKLNLEGQVDVTIGTFSKALGSLGAFAAGSRELVDFLVNRARSLIYSTALPPAVLAVNIAALELVENNPSLRQALLSNARKLAFGLKQIGLEVSATETAIIPVILGDATRTQALSEVLFREGILAKAIRPPTVPVGTSRIRVTASAVHDEEDLALAIAAFRRGDEETRSAMTAVDKNHRQGNTR